MKLRVVVPPHPLIDHWLSIIRCAQTPSPIYAKGLEELGRWLTYEALRDWLPFRNEIIETTNSKTEGRIIEPEIPLLAIPFLPGGIELWIGARNVLPNVQFCLGGVPAVVEEKAGIMIFFDQITNASSLLKTLTQLENKNIESKQIRVITCIASNEGLIKIGEKFPSLTIYSACIDPEVINENELKPGIGNPSLRLNTRIAVAH